MMKKIAVRAMITLAVVVALCMFFSGTIRTITTAKVRFTSARQGKFEMTSELTGKVQFKETEELKLDVPEGTALTVTRVFVKPGAAVEAGDKLISATVVDYDKTIASLNVGVEFGQHCSCSQANRNFVFDDGTPDDPNHPDGLSGWFRDVVNAAR